jgi:hypothetical protein
MAMLAQRGGQTTRQRDKPDPPAFRNVDLALPRRPLHRDLTVAFAMEVDIVPIQRRHLATPQSRFAALPPSVEVSADNVLPLSKMGSGGLPVLVEAYVAFVAARSSPSCR